MKQKQLTPTFLRKNLYSVLDQVVKKGESVVINRNGVLLQIVPPVKSKKIDRLIAREVVNGDLEDLATVDMKSVWNPDSFLDTHILVWLYGKNLELLTQKALTLIEECQLMVSPINVLELEYLFEINRLKVGANKIINDLQKRIDLRVAEESFAEIIKHSLDINWTRDAFDRILVAHCALSESKLLTKDAIILKHYKKAVW